MSNDCRVFVASVMVGGLGPLGCGFDWEGAYATRFEREPQGGTAAAGGIGSVSTPQVGGSTIQGGTSSAGGRHSIGTGGLGGANAAVGAGGRGSGGEQLLGGSYSLGGSGNLGGANAVGGAGVPAEGGAPPSGGSGGAGGAIAGGQGGIVCSNNLVINAGFEEVSGEVPAYWSSTGLPSSLKNEVVTTADLAIEGARSLFVDTTNVKNPPVDYMLLVTSSPWAATPGEVFHLSAAARVTDPANPARVAVVYYDSQGALIDLTAAPNLSFPPPSSDFVREGPLESVAPARTATARIGVVAGTDVSAYVDAICLTR